MEILKSNREKLLNIKPEASPEWGTMTPQHMIEHLADAVTISNSKKNVESVTPPEKIEKLKQFLWSDNPLPKNVKNPWAKQEGLEPLRNKNIKQAVEELESELRDFEAYFEKNPSAKTVHPTFGPLTKEDWIQMHTKHFIHHFQQFNLL